MKTTVLKGGLGNQLFQYAFGRFISKNKLLALDTSSYSFDRRKRKYYLNKLNIKATNFSNIYLSRFIKKVSKEYKEKNEFSFKSNLNNSSYSYFNGYWQHYKYPEINRSILLKELSPKISKTILMPKNSVVIHIRRGDYVQDEETKKLYHQLPLIYYQKAIKNIEKKVTSPKYYIFSDDIVWVKNNFKIEQTHQIIEGNDPITDLTLMSRCSHFITANSTFSWWGAWLSQEKDKIVITPKKWFKNKSSTPKGLIPKGWITL